MSVKPTLAYWDIRAIAQPIRNLLHYAGVEFTDKRYSFGPGSSPQELDSIRQHWYKEKFTLGLDFPNVPYWIEGDLKLTHSLAILKYLARKHGLIASDVITLAKQEMIEQQLIVYRSAFFGVCFSADFPAERDNYLKIAVPQHLEALDKYLGDNQWLSKELSYVDFLAYELLDWIRLLSNTALDKYNRLKEYMTRFESLPPIKKYHTSSAYKDWPLTSPHAKWGFNK